MPILFSSEREDNTEIPAGSVGIVTAKGGQSLPAGVFVAEGEEHQGIQRKVLTPGTYRVNKKGFDVEIVKATEIAPGFVGVQRRLLGRDGQGQYAADDGEKGILRTVLHPGLYYINTKAVLLALDQVNGDISGDQAKFRDALSKLSFDTPTGKVSLDKNRQAIADIYLTEVTKGDDGKLYNKVVKTVPQVNQTLGIDEAAFLKLGAVGRDNPSCP